jgi:uncharacterized coiled-coil protein SlyX
MSLTSQDLKAIKTIVDDTVRISTDIVRQEIKASEARTDKKLDALEVRVETKIEAMGQRLEAKMDAMEDRILQGVSDTLQEHVYPKFDDHEKRLTKLETKTA